MAKAKDLGLQLAQPIQPGGPIDHKWEDDVVKNAANQVLEGRWDALLHYAKSAKELQRSHYIVITTCHMPGWLPSFGGKGQCPGILEASFLGSQLGYAKVFAAP